MPKKINKEEQKSKVKELMEELKKSQPNITDENFFEMAMATWQDIRNAKTEEGKKKS